jgi:hypothetical protein
VAVPAGKLHVSLESGVMGSWRTFVHACPATNTSAGVMDPRFVPVRTTDVFPTRGQSTVVRVPATAPRAVAGVSTHPVMLSSRAAAYDTRVFGTELFSGVVTTTLTDEPTPAGRIHEINFVLM